MRVYNFVNTHVINFKRALYKSLRIMEQKNTIPDPKVVDFTVREFIANGKKYYISDKICIARWKEYEKLSPRLTYGIGFDEMQKSLTKAFSLLNKPNPEPLNAGIVIHNVLNGVKDANDDSRIHPSLLMCALIINREGEDVGVFDKQIQMDKINDWETEGLDILSFFAFALRSINGFRETYLSFIQVQAESLQREINKK